MITWHEMMTKNQIDNYNNYGGNTEHANDYVILSRHRDSSIVENSNFEIALQMLKKIDKNNDVYVLSFRHWAVGWLEHLFIKHSAHNELIQEGENIQNSLADYPLLDESDYFQNQFEEIHSYWDSLSLREKIKYAKCHDLSIFSIRYDIPEEIYQDLESEIY